MTQAQARLQFANWLQETHPEIFARAIAIAENSTNSGLGIHEATAGTTVTTGGSFWEKFTSAAVGVGTTYLTLKNQRDAMKINLERAQVGLPPIDMATSAPVIRTQVDLSPELTTRLVSNVGSVFQPMLIAGAAILAFFLFSRKR